MPKSSIHRVPMLGFAILFVIAFAAMPDKAAAGGTHFLVEPYSGLIFNQGLNLEDAVGLESGAFLAVGGKFTGFPPRFYLYMKTSFANFGSEDLFIASRDATACVERSYTKVTGGLRIIVPVYWRLRVQLELGGGQMFSRNRYAESGRDLVEYDESLAAMELGIGLNLRVFRWLSVGLMYNYTFVAEEENGDLIATMLGESNHGAQMSWSHLNATLGFHF